MHPTEVSEEIEANVDKDRTVRDAQRQTRERQAKIVEFWEWATEWMKGTGNDEAELMRRFPEFKRRIRALRESLPADVGIQPTRKRR